MTRHICQTCGWRVATNPVTVDGTCIWRYAFKLVQANEKPLAAAKVDCPVWRRKRRKKVSRE